MGYSIEVQSGIDIDWYAIDKNGCVIHFASGGGMLPLSVSRSKEETEKVAKYCRSLPLLDQLVYVNNKLEEIKQFASIKDKERYLTDFISMSKRGFFSFDKNEPGNFSEKKYHLVSYPQNPISIDSLPGDIQSLISQIQLISDIRDVTLLSLDELGKSIYAV